MTDEADFDARLKATLRKFRPDLTDAEFDAKWAAFVELRAAGDALRAQGIALHPTFGTRPVKR